MTSITPVYHKIQSVLKRDPDNNYKTFLKGQWSEPEFGYLAFADWEATEKIDGTNCRIHIRDDGYSMGGRTDNAQLHVDLVMAMDKTGAIACHQGLHGLTLYGEGYGAGIQKGGGNYRSDKGFILFDVMVTDTGMFLERDNVEDIAQKLGINCVSVMWTGTLNMALGIFDLGLTTDPTLTSVLTSVRIQSAIKDSEAEGWVLRPTVELRNRAGKRIITKIKVKDFLHREVQTKTKEEE